MACSLALIGIYGIQLPDLGSRTHQFAMPLSHLARQRVTDLYDLTDATCCSKELHEHYRTLRHVPLIDHNPRSGEKGRPSRRTSYASANAAPPTAPMRASKTNSRPGTSNGG